MKFHVFKSGYLSKLQLISIYKFIKLCVCYLWNVTNKMISNDFHAFASVRQHKKRCFQIIFKVQKSFQVKQTPLWTCENRRKTTWHCLCLRGYPWYFCGTKVNKNGTSSIQRGWLTKTDSFRPKTYKCRAPAKLFQEGSAPKSEQTSTSFIQRGWPQ